MKQKEEEKDLENYQGGGGGGGGGGHGCMYETGKTEESPNAKGLALLITKTSLTM